MKQHIHLGAIVAREGRILLLRLQTGSPWELPGGPLPLDADDTDAAMLIACAADVRTGIAGHPPYTIRVAVPTSVLTL